MSDEILTAADMVTAAVAGHFPTDVIPTGAIVLIEVMDGEGRGLQFMRSAELSTWAALGILRSATLRFEQMDLDGWPDADDA